LFHGIEAVRSGFLDVENSFLHLSKTIALNEQDSNPFTIKGALKDGKA